MRMPQYFKVIIKLKCITAFAGRNFILNMYLTLKMSVKTFETYNRFHFLDIIVL